MLIIDLNSVVMASLMVGTDPDAYKVDDQVIRTAEYGWTNFTKSFRKAIDLFELTPMQVIGVYDAPKSRVRRQRIYKAYKEHREKRPQEFYDEFNTLMTDIKKFMRDLGCIIVWAKQTEADDVIARIAPKIEDSIIWSKDKDLLSIGTTMYIHGAHGGIFEGETCEDKFYDVKRKYVRLVRTLLSDTGDFGPGMGAIGFGEKAFLNMWGVFGEDGFDSLIDMIERKALDEIDPNDVVDCPALQKIIDSADTVYLTWRLAGWLKVHDHNLKWSGGLAMPSTVDSYDEDFDEYYGRQTLVTAENFERIMPVVKAYMEDSPYVPFDIEADQNDKSKAWLKRMQGHMSKPLFLDVHGQNLTGGSITVGDNLQHTYYFSVRHKDTDNITKEEFMDMVMDIDKYIIAHNAGGFEIPVMKTNCDDWIPTTLDNAIAASYVDENAFSKALKTLSKTWLDYSQATYQEVTQGRDMSELTGEEVLSYGCDDTITTGHQFNLFTTIMQVEGTMDAFMKVETSAQYMVASAYHHGINFDPKALSDLAESDKAVYEEELAKVTEYLTKIEYPGTYYEATEEITPAWIKESYKMLVGKPLKTRFRKLEKIIAAMKEESEGNKKILEFCGLLEGLIRLGAINRFMKKNFKPSPKFKVNSSKNIGHLFYEFLAFPIKWRNALTKSQKKAGLTKGTPSTDEDTLRWFIKENCDDEQKDFIESLIRCKAYITRRGLYYEPYPYLAHWSDGKLRPSLRQSGTTSRRFAPSGPNVNQMPKNSSSEGKKIRRCIIPHHPDAVIISPDFDSQELKVAAEASQDQALLSCYMGNDRKDLHSLTGFAICQKQGNEYASYEAFQADINKQTATLADEYRGRKGKKTNFLAQYSGTSYMISKQLRVSESEGQVFLDAKAEAFPGYDKFMVEYQQEIFGKKFATTFLGARKHLYKPLIFGKEDHVLRSGLNFRIQSSSAEITKLALGKIWEEGLMKAYNVRFYMPVHDELCFSVMKSDLVAFCAELRPIMEQDYAGCKVKFTSSLSVGPNFGQLDEIGWDGIQDWLDDFSSQV